MCFCFQNRSLAAVLLRKLFTSKFDDSWPHILPDSQVAIKTYLMNLIQQEQDHAVRRKVCDAIAELARNMLGMKTSGYFLRKTNMGIFRL